MATSPMVVDSGCGSSSESEVWPVVEAATNKDSKPLVDATGFSSQQKVVGPFAQLRNAIAIIERVQKLVTDSVWNKKQCQRIADRDSVIAKKLKSIMGWDGNLTVGEAFDSGSRSKEVDGLLHELQKGEDLISGYGGSQGITNVVLAQNNPKAFKDHHEELDAAMAKLGLQGMEYSTELTSGQEEDAEADKEEMLKKLSTMPNVGNLAKVVLEKTTDVDVKSLVKGNPENLPSYLKISQDEIVFGKPVREYRRQSSRDPEHELNWAQVKEGKWLNCDFAIKVFNCGAGDDRPAEWNQRQLLMEVGSLVELQHPHVVRLVGFGQDAKQSIFVMELMDADLRDFMSAKLEPFTASEKLDIIFQIAKGMYYIHTKGFAHGDLKCTNILVKKYGHYLEVKIGDLRGSQKRGEWNRDAFKQASNVRRARWTAPEAIDHDGQDKPSWEFLKRMDIYSFGMTCYEIVTGGYPFDGERDEKELVKQIKKGGRPILPKTLDEHLKGLITSCWDENPEKRPSFEDVCKSLDFIRSKLLPVEKDRSCGTALTNVMLNQFKDINVLNHFKNTFKNIGLLDQGHRHFQPEELTIPEYLKIDPKQLTRGELIGSGNSATVYKTTWLRCTFAEKVMKKEGLTTDFVQQEMNSLIKVSRHPCIALLVGLSVHSDGACSIIMEYMDGDLRQLINARMKNTKRLLAGPLNGPFELHEEVLIISKIALGMAYLHSRGLVHRDLNSLNVLAQERCEKVDVKIVDFGLSHDEKPLSDVQTVDGYYRGWGFRFYRAPEMLPESPGEELPLGLPDPSATLDLQGLKRADVFSFAITCYEVLTGKLVWPDLPTQAYAEVRSKQRRPEWPKNPDSKPKRLQLESLVERCWQMIPEDRPTFDEICKELLMIQTSS